MSKKRKCFEGIVPLVCIWAFAILHAEANTLPQNYGVRIDGQNKVSLRITERQANKSDILISSSLPNKVEQSPAVRANRIELLQDIKPTDWSYQALQNLIERYRCISGFENNTYRGEETLTRAEFAAGLNSCLSSMERIVARTQVTQVDIDTILRLMQEFQSELAILQGRTDGAQARLEDLEATQFSSTSKLQGEAIIGLGSVLTDDRPQTVLGSRLRLDFQSSFRGNDLLFARLSQNNFVGYAEELETFQGELAFADAESDFSLDTLYYSFDVGDRVGLIVGAVGVEADDIAPAINILDGDGGSGSISRFGTRNPLYYPPGDAGLGINHSPIDSINISAGYLAGNANDSSSGNGLFDGPYSALGQIAIEPFSNLSLAATYIHSYNQSDTETGTNRANLRTETEAEFGDRVPTVSNSYGLEISWSIGDRFVIGGWGGLSKVSNLSTLNQQLDRGSLDIWNWAATLAIPDLGHEGSLAGVIVGSEPKATNSTIDNLPEDDNSALHIEAFYQYQIDDNISVTPGVVWITEPDSNTQDDEDLVIGTIRTTFSF